LKFPFFLQRYNWYSVGHVDSFLIQ
jgi:hypothetical protein